MEAMDDDAFWTGMFRAHVESPGANHQLGGGLSLTDAMRLARPRADRIIIGVGDADYYVLGGSWFELPVVASEDELPALERRRASGDGGLQRGGDGEIDWLVTVRFGFNAPRLDDAAATIRERFPGVHFCTSGWACEIAGQQRRLVVTADTHQQAIQVGTALVDEVASHFSGNCGARLNLTMVSHVEAWPHHAV
jgi:hypothetical protein